MRLLIFTSPLIVEPMTPLLYFENEKFSSCLEAGKNLAFILFIWVDISAEAQILLFRSLCILVASFFLQFPSSFAASSGLILEPLKSRESKSKAKQTSLH